ncbi:hypothetical protein WKK05_03625 [Nostoc sp. UHCC 0302]|uniref:hypothetical protein n=1 Tax=Nostoc sp. UHCC 0302 TaxID=3134896 RepID=UPI00311C97E4
MNLSGINYNIASLIFPIGLLIILIGIRYIATTRVIGSQKANKELLNTLPWVLFGFIFGFFIARFGKYKWLTFLILYEVYFISYLIYLLTWHWRKKQAGYLIANLGWFLSNKRLVWLNLVSVLFAAIYSALFLHQDLTKGSIYRIFDSSHLGGIIVVWSVVIISSSRELSKLGYTDYAHNNCTI